MLIAATSDAHTPQFFEEFVRAVDMLTVRPDLLLLAGDMINRGGIENYDKVYNVLFGKFNCPIVACFGNNEYQELREQIRKKYTDIKFLDDEATVLDIGGKTVGIIGTTGSLDTPTPWQRKNIPNIELVYQNRVNFVDRLLQRLVVDLKIVMTHYAPTFKILEGENPKFYTSQGSERYESVIIEKKPDFVVCGHAHRGLKQVWLDTIPVFNVAIPVNHQVVLIDTEKDLKPGIAKFV
jgi:Icc-related predicted phosphoesterase